MTTPQEPSPKEKALERLAICAKCPHLWKKKICKKCGCIVPAKVRLKRSSCPIGKW